MVENAVMISIRPTWAYLICIGSKTVEIRKTAPKIKPPFKCFIYCTKPKEKYGDVIQTGKAHYYGGGKVVGEFVCDAIEKLDMDSAGLLIDRTKEYTDWNPCMTKVELLQYTGGMKPYGWHISDLKIYDQPKPISDFKRWQGTGAWSTLERLKRAPQSWCYVDGGLIG